MSVATILASQRDPPRRPRVLWFTEPQRHLSLAPAQASEHVPASPRAEAVLIPRVKSLRKRLRQFRRLPHDAVLDLADLIRQARSIAGVLVDSYP